MKKYANSKFTFSKFLTMLTAIACLITAIPTKAYVRSNVPSQQSDNTYSFKKSQTDEYEDIISKVKNMSDEEVENNLNNYESLDLLFEKTALEICKPRFDEHILNESQRLLAINMVLDAFNEKHPDYNGEEYISKLLDDDELSDSDILKKIENEKNRFEKLGTVDGVKCFKIEEGIETSINPKIFLITIRKINDILEKYSEYTNGIAITSKYAAATFKIHTFDGNENKNTQDFTMYIKHYYRTSKNKNLRLLNIFLSKKFLNNLWALGHANLAQILIGYHPYVEADELISNTVAHEIGHIFEFWMFTTAVNRLNNEGIDITISNKNYIKFTENIKKTIVETAKEKYNATYSAISEYGETSSLEWFAEVFANLECSDEENISAYGKVAEDVIKMFANREFTVEYLKSLMFD